jgi:alpha-tubulin suppressor-like RCC1 family protein
MLIRFQGLNVSARKVESFEIENVLNYNNKSESIVNFENFYLTFDSIFFKSSQFNVVFILDLKAKHFEPVHNDQDSQVLTAASNTNYLYLLTVRNSQFEIVQYSGKHLIKKIQLQNLNELNLYKDLILASTDINVYLFQNEDSGLKCLFNLNDFESSKNKKQLATELQLNENSTSSLPPDLVLLDEACKSISTGKEHIVFQTASSNKLFSFGVGLKGQLGNNRIENCFEKAESISLENADLVQSGGWHSGVVDKSGDCFMWGWNSSCQLGITTGSDVESVFVPTPTKISVCDFGGEKLSEVKFRKLSVGARHTALISTQNSAYVFGWNKYGQLFLEQDNSAMLIQSRSGSDESDRDEIIEEPTKLDQFENEVCDVKCGCWFTLIMTF